MRTCVAKINIVLTLDEEPNLPGSGSRSCLVDARLVTAEYLKSVRRFLLSWGKLRKEDLKRRYQNFLLKRDRVHDIHYTAPDPEFDAWMAVTGNERKSFDKSILEQSFLEMDFGGNLQAEATRP